MRRCSEPFFLMVLEALLYSAVFSTREPEFVDSANNVTVIRGRDAELPCIVNHLSKYQVAWVKVDTQTILTIHKSVITRNYRLTLKHEEHRNWFLHIKNVSEADRGYYMCQVNTEPMRSKSVYLNVTVSPNIIDDETSSDLIVNEGVNVTLTCRASGYPPPLITWEREDGQDISLNGSKKVKNFRGEDLVIYRVSRLHMGAYLCIASNQVPPAVSKRIVLKVHFSPMIWVPNQLVGGTVGTDVMLECYTEAFPKSINYWTNEKGDMVTSGDKDKYTTIFVDTNYKVIMRLKIHFLVDEDYGLYKCFAKNSLGETDGTIRLYEIPKPTPKYSTTTDRLNFESKGYLGEYRIKSGEKYESEHTDDGEFMTTKGRKQNSSSLRPEDENLHSISNIRDNLEMPQPTSNGEIQRETSLQTLCLVLWVLKMVL